MSSLKGLLNPSIPNVGFVVFDPMALQAGGKLLLKGHVAMALHLASRGGLDRVNISRSHREHAIASLPKEAGMEAPPNTTNGELKSRVGSVM